MYIKVTTTRTKDKTYRYVKIAQAIWDSSTGDRGQSVPCSRERIVCTIGILEEVIASRESLIRGLQALDPR